MIREYNPTYIDSTPELIKMVRSVICPCIGKEMKASWIGWMKDYDCWWEDMPVILQLGDDRIEISWIKFQDVSITKNQIAVDGSAHLTEGASIRKNSHEILNKFIGKTVTGIEVGESTMSFGNSGEIVIPNSINFIFGEEFLSIFNGLDENGITDERPNENVLQSSLICPV